MDHRNVKYVVDGGNYSQVTESYCPIADNVSDCELQVQILS
jgi:hypothetical protein